MVFFSFLLRLMSYGDGDLSSFFSFFIQIHYKAADLLLVFFSFFLPMYCVHIVIFTSFLLWLINLSFFFHFQSYTQHITNIIYTVHEFIYQLSLSMCVSFLRIKIHRKHRLIKKEKTLYKSYYSLHLLTDLFFLRCCWCCYSWSFSLVLCMSLVWYVCVSVFISFEINRWMDGIHTNEKEKNYPLQSCLEFAKIRLSNLSDIFLSFFRIHWWWWWWWSAKTCCWTSSTWIKYLLCIFSFVLFCFVC